MPGAAVDDSPRSNNLVIIEWLIDTAGWTSHLCVTFPRSPRVLLTGCAHHQIQWQLREIVWITRGGGWNRIDPQHTHEWDSTTPEVVRKGNEWNRVGCVHNFFCRFCFLVVVVVSVPLLHRKDFPPFFLFNFLQVYGRARLFYLYGHLMWTLPGAQLVSTCCCTSAWKQLQPLQPTY